MDDSADSGLLWMTPSSKRNFHLSDQYAGASVSRATRALRPHPCAAAASPAVALHPKGAAWLSGSVDRSKAPAGTHCTVTSTSTSARCHRVTGKIDRLPVDSVDQVLRRRLQLVAAWMELSPVAPNAEPQQQQGKNVLKCSPNSKWSQKQS